MSVSSSIQILARVRLLLLARIQFTVCLQHCGGRPYKHEIFYGARGEQAGTGGYYVDFTKEPRGTC
jgi:hypothetical protein